MDRLNFGTLTGFYAVECGNVLGLGGAFLRLFVPLVFSAKKKKRQNSGISADSSCQPQKDYYGKTDCRTASDHSYEPHDLCPCCRRYSRRWRDEIPWKEISLMHLAYYLLQVELAGICFGISAFLRKGSAGVGLGIAAMMYFLNLIANIADVAEFLKYITPFGYCEGADIVANGRLDGAMVAIGVVMGIGGIVIAYL